MGEIPAEAPRRYSRRRLLLTSAAAAAGGAATVAIGGGVALAADRGAAPNRSPRKRPAMSRSRPVWLERKRALPWCAPGGHHNARAGACHLLRLRPARRGRRRAAGQVAQDPTDDLEHITAGRPALGEYRTRTGDHPRPVDRHHRIRALHRSTSSGLAAARPAGFVDLPAFPEIDQLEDRYSGGDLLLQICADDQITLAHAQRMLLKDTRAFASTRSVQPGFLRARGSGAEGSTPRNLMGQVDGTVNPRTDDQFDSLVWSPGPGWFTGGTMMVIRRIRMDMNRWDELDRSAMETTVGRRLSNGAPLTGVDEHDEPDLKATDATGLHAIADFAHLRLARGEGAAAQILRRPYNYDDSPGADGDSDLGLIFCSFQADIESQFVPMQQRLASGDLLNQWTTPIGSAVFAIPPGCQPGGFIGEGLPV